MGCGFDSCHWLHKTSGRRVVRQPSDLSFCRKAQQGALRVGLHRTRLPSLSACTNLPVLYDRSWRTERDITLNWGFVVMGRTGGENCAICCSEARKTGKFAQRRMAVAQASPGAATKDCRRASLPGAATQERRCASQPGSRAGFLSLTVGGQGRPEPHRVLLRFGLAARIPLRATS